MTWDNKHINGDLQVIFESYMNYPGVETDPLRHGENWLPELWVISLNFITGRLFCPNSIPCIRLILQSLLNPLDTAEKLPKPPPDTSAKLTYI